MEVDIKEYLREYKRTKIDRTYKKLIACKSDFFVRMGSECNELLFDGRHRVYRTDTNNFPGKFIFLFNSVQRDARKFLAKNPIIDISPRVEVTKYNYLYDHDRGIITGTDLDHAFWRIAYIKNYISKRTYNYGLNKEAKALRLATLSVLGREKAFDKYVEGEFIEKVITKKLDPHLHSVYKDIRFSCYYMMYELSLLLGDEFDCWRTDCIYYRDTVANRKIVHDYFDEREMLYKQLIFTQEVEI
ncbi:MAG: hypothetical protein WCJ62_12565 [Flavobacterium sp.]